MRAVVSLLLVLCACTPKPTPPIDAPTMIFFVRHAEKATDQGDDPPLTALGSARALDLERLLRHSGIRHIFTTQYKRTQLTVDPLAKALGLTPTIVSAKDQDAQLAALRRLPPGSVALVAGHSNTVPPMVRALGGQTPDLADPDYDRVLILGLVRTATGTRGTTAELRLNTVLAVD